MPVTDTVFAAAPPPVVTAKIAVAAHVAVGAKTRLMEQLVPTATDDPQVDASENTVEFVPVSAMLVIGNVSVPVFVTVTVCGALEVFVCTLPKAILVGDTV